MGEKEPKRKPTRRINLAISAKLREDVRRAGERLELSEADFTRHMLRLGLELYKASVDPNRGVFFQEPGEKEPQRIRLII